MKKVNLIIVIFLLTIGFTAETLGQSSLPTTTTIEVQTQKIESIRIIDAESNAFNEVVSGYNVNTNKRFLSINKENISHILSDENDIENSDHSCSYVSIEDNLLSVAGVVNSTSKLGMNTDIQSRIVIWDTNSKTKLHSFTFRNLESWRYLADQQLYKDKYLYILMNGVKEGTTIQTEYSGIPFNGSGTNLSGNGASLIQIDLDNYSMREYYWEGGTAFRGNSLLVDDDGSIYTTSMESSFSTKIRIHKFNENLTEQFSVEIDRDSNADHKYDQPLGILEHNEKKVLALTDGRLPVTLDLNTLEVKYSKHQDVAGNDLTSINGVTDIESIKQIPGTNQFLLTKTDQKIEYGNAWFMIFDINAERKIYFREDLILPEEGSVARPHIISSFLNEKGEIFYSAAIYQNGTVIMNDIVLADGSQGADDVIIFSGTLSGLKPEGPEESGISEYQLNQGSYEILDDNDVIFSGISNPANFQITRVAHPGYIVAPETSVVNITKNDVYFTATLNIESDQLTKEATVMKIYKEGLASSLSTENFENNSFGMYPNPTSGNIFFKEDMNMTGKTADIFDLTGRKIISHKFISGSNPIDLGALSTGMYLIRITENGKILGSKKILKQ